MNVYYVAGIPYSDELYHFGIKGQKWGIRRYQNPDGTLTPAGKARYGTDVTNLKPKELRIQANAASDAKRLVKVNRVADSIQKKMQNSKEYKEYNNMNRALSVFRRGLAESMGVREDQIRFDEKTTRDLDDLRTTFLVKSKEIYNENKDKLASALLEDLGYDVTDSGREYVKKYIYND